MQSLASALLLASAVILSGCSALLDRTWHSEQLLLLQPNSGPRELLKQRITLQTPGAERQFLALLKLDSQKSQVAVLNASGQQLLKMHYQQGSFTLQAPTSLPFDAREVFASLQLALWPEPAVIKRYDQAHWQLQATPVKRLLSLRGRPVIQVEYQPEHTLVTDYRRGYKVVVETLEESNE